MRQLARTTLIMVGCLSLLAGLGLSRKFFLFSLDWILLALLFLWFVKKKRITLVIVVLAGLGLGLWRGTIYMQKLTEINQLSGERVSLTVTATTDAVYASNSQLEFTANQVYLTQPQAKSLSGNFKISGFGLPMVYRGDHLRAEGKLYTSRGSTQARVSYARLTLISHGDQWYSQLSRKFSTGIENALPEPQASFGMGLLIGQRTNLTQGIINQLTIVGLVHIVAVSGYNLTILVRAAQRLNIQSKYQRTLLSICLITVFLLVTGFSASIVRAAVISILSIWAAYYGRTIKPILLIAFAAALTGFINPFYVWSDIGWYLSFLAFFGVLVIAPLISARLFKRPPKFLTLVLIETLCAEVMTLPLIMMVFGQMSLVALLANLIVVPLVPAAMLFSTISGCAGILVPQLAGWLSWPANVLLTYILDIVHLLASIPSIFLHLYLSPTLMVSLYLAIIAVVWTLHHRLKQVKTTRLVT